MKMTNFKIERTLEDIKTFLIRADIIGYAVAKNIRMLMNALEAYSATKDFLVKEYGYPILDDNGQETGTYRITAENPNYEKLLNELNKIGNIEQDIDIFTIPSTEVIDKLTGTEILKIDFMLED